MTRRERKHFQSDRARIRANRTRYNITKYNQPRVKMGRAGMAAAPRSGPGQRNVLEMMIQNAVRMAMQRPPTVQLAQPVRRVGSEGGNALVDLLTVLFFGILLFLLIWFFTGCTPRY